MTVNFKVVIPARYASIRLPGKPLIRIHGKPMIQWVYEAALKSQVEEVIVASDDERILDAVESFSGSSCKTLESHQTGTDRIVEVIEKMGWPDDTVVVNLQGDEPMMPGENLTQVAANLVESGYEMATLYQSITDEEAADPHHVKLVKARNGRALYFSRSRIPYNQDNGQTRYLGHIGLYAYRVDFLKTYAKLPPCMLEQTEKLEQLRALHHGYDIHTQEARTKPGRGVDTEQDLLFVSEQLNGHQK